MAQATHMASTLQSVLTSPALHPASAISTANMDQTFAGDTRLLLSTLQLASKLAQT